MITQKSGSYSLNQLHQLSSAGRQTLVGNFMRIGDLTYLQMVSTEGQD